MARPLSLDLRERIAAALASGLTTRAVAQQFSVSVATAVRIGQKQRAGQGLEPGKMGGHRPFVLGPEAVDWLRERLAEKGDLTIRALTAELAERGTVVTPDTVWRCVRRLGLSFKKKTLLAKEQDGTKLARFRARWKAHQHKIDPKRLVFIDETWVKTNMTRTRGWCAQGQPYLAKVPHGHWKTLTFLAGLRHDRIVAPLVLDGPINGTMFTAWVEQFLVPTLAPGDVVVLDNLGSHKGAAARNAIRNVGAHLLFLPPYSPDLNPIEMMFAKLKTLVRKAEERTIEAVWRRIGNLLEHFQPHECAA
ncbi:IS630 family transposase, partial [Azospirillum agricola]|uniref:IS630 family transposase n=1 Tax=Azospirillum agricola TaxID=1720247 RepID=UPI001CBD3210